MRESCQTLTEVIDTCFVRNTAIPEHIQADVQKPAQSSPYGDDYGMEAPVPVLMQPKEAAGNALTLSAPQEVFNDQARRSHLIPPKEEDQANQSPAINSEKKIIKELITLTEVGHRAQSGLDQCSLDQHIVTN